MAPGRHASSRSSAPNFTSERDRRDNGWDQEREHNHGSREKSRDRDRDRDRDRFRDRGSREGDERDMASNGPLRTSLRYQDEENVPSRPDSAMSITSYSPSQSSGGHSQDAIGAAKFGKDKEPGELSSGSKSEDGDLSPVHKKKRKYSPIVWDLDDKQARHKPSKVPESSKFVSKQWYPDGAKPSKASPSESHLMASRASSVGQISNSPQQLERLERGERAKIPPPTVDVEAGEGEQELPPTIAASRWAEEAHSPSPSPAKSIPSVQQSVSTDGGDMVTPSGSESQEGSQRSTSPEPGEYVKESETVEEVEIKPGADDDREIQEGQNNNVADEEYEEDLNKRELMELDEDEDEGQADEEEEQPELDPESEEGPFTPPQPQQRAIDMLRGCRSVDAFERLNKIDEGTYGVVYRARDKRTGEIVALKKVKMERERDGFPMTSLREINVLLSFHHPSVVDVKEVVVGNSLDSIFMVMEYMEHDLKGLMESMKQPFSQSEVKCLMLQLFNGVKYLHDNWVLHRDLKTSNLLLNNRGELKICDFGLARQYGSPLKTYTKTVVTLWYRAPELLLGARKYSTAIDMWSLGCIMAELLAKEPLFNGKSEIEQIDKIFRTLGTPNEKIWPDYVNLPAVKKCNFKNHPYNKLREKFRSTSFFGRPLLSENGMDLLNRLLTYDPLKRITAEEALQHNWFQEVPLPKMKELMPTFPVRNDHDRRLKRLMKSPDPLEEQRKRELRQGSDLGTGGLFG